MASLLERIALCTERGKVNRDAPYPPDLKGEDGADELTAQALAEGIDPNDLLQEGLMTGMSRIGEKFGKGEAFVPDLLMAARAMNAGMAHLKPFFEAGITRHKGTFVIGTVQGDLHDIGKNLVAMIVEGGGWEVIDLGVDVSAEKFLETIEAHPGCVVGLSALLTTTMANMASIVRTIKEKHPETKVLVGGAPLTQDYCEKIGADHYSRDPQSALGFLAARSS
ncbi:MAG: corrinoid protein [Candidatus Hydrogenedentes bacterium]|nr:corrinoid protein [Candidatus Hydrogenedentota bacterium]